MLPRFLNDFIDKLPQNFLVTLASCYLIVLISNFILLKRNSFKIKITIIIANLIFISNYLYTNKNNLNLIGVLLFLSASIFFFFFFTKLIIFFYNIIYKTKIFFNNSKKTKIKLRGTRTTQVKNMSTTLTKKASPFGSPQVMTSFGLKVRSKSEVFIAEKLYEKKINFKYEIPLSAGGKTYYPDFTLYFGKREIYWEHFGMMNDENYAEKTAIKIKWYKKNFPNKLIWTEESSQLMPQIHKIADTLAKSKQHYQIHQILKQMHDSKEHASPYRRI